MRSALVVEDGDSPYVLAAVRSLARAGWRVGVASPRPNPRVVPSRACAAWHPTRRPEDDLDGFVVDVAAAVRAGAYRLVFGADDVELLVLSARRDEVDALLPHAPHAAVVDAVDKLALTRAAERVGLAAPRTVEATPAAVAAADGPVVVKARWHWTPGAASRHQLVAVCPDRAAVTARVAEIESAGGAAVLQEPVDGRQLAVSVVLDGAGRPLAWAQQRTVLAGLARTSVRAVTVPVDRDLLDGTVALLGALGWTGLANVQFLQRPGGRPQVIDLNGRFYGSLALAVAAGADLPAVWAATATGEALPAGRQARPGVRFHALTADLSRAAVQRRGGLVRDVAGVLRWGPGAAHSTWSLTDPRPGAALAAGLAGRAARRVVRRSAPPDQPDH